MTILKEVGFYFELPSEEQIAVLRSICRESPDPDADRIVRYLNAGVAIAAVPGVEVDVLAEPPQIIGAMHIRTDGVWAWPQTLVHYVQRYHIALPQEFVDHMRSSGWECPQGLIPAQFALEGWTSID